MKKSILFIIFCSVIVNAQNANIKKSIDTFFEGLNKRDTLKIKSVCMINFTLQTIEEKGIVSNLFKTPISKFFSGLATVPKDATIEERIVDYQYQIDGTMAVVWMPYQFYFNEKLLHTGVNVFTMFKDDGNWKVVSIIDTRRKSAQ